mmetsp:Transcript_35841/g.114792  ORF Transcript_35841/g.114792 Transcript_35841/m.114792 type:complete len:216 (-) Transcript_35841:319-966(-)
MRCLTRVVELSQDSILEVAPPRSSAFEFPGVGGRCSLRTDGETLGVEVNFFHGSRRSGLVLYYKNNSVADIMSMAFRAAPISHDDNATFVDTPSVTVVDQSDPIDAKSRTPSAKPCRRVSHCLQCSSLDRNHKISMLDRNEDIDWDDTEHGQYFIAELPDNILLRVPTMLTGDATLSFGCDFRAIGGPLRSVSIEFSESKCVQWCCHEQCLDQNP